MFMTVAVVCVLFAADVEVLPKPYPYKSLSYEDIEPKDLKVSVEIVGPAPLPYQAVRLRATLTNVSSRRLRPVPLPISSCYIQDPQGRSVGLGRGMLIGDAGDDPTEASDDVFSPRADAKKKDLTRKVRRYLVLNPPTLEPGASLSYSFAIGAAWRMRCGPYPERYEPVFTTSGKYRLVLAYPIAEKPSLEGENSAPKTTGVELPIAVQQPEGKDLAVYRILEKDPPLASVFASREALLDEEQLARLEMLIRNGLFWDSSYWSYAQFALGRFYLARQKTEEGIANLKPLSRQGFAYGPAACILLWRHLTPRDPAQATHYKQYLERTWPDAWELTVDRIHSISPEDWHAMVQESCRPRIRDGALRLDPLRIWGVTSGWPSDIVFVPGKATIFTGGAEGEVRLWDYSRTGGPLPRQYHGSRQRVEALAVAPSGRIAVSGTNQNVVVWDLASIEEQREAKLKTLSYCDGGAESAGHLKHLAFSPDGRFLLAAIAASSQEQPDLVIWETCGWRQVASSRFQEESSPRPSFIGFTSDARKALYVDNRGQGIWRTIEYLPEKGTAQISEKKAGWLTTAVNWHSAAISPDGKLLAAACRDGNVRVWEIDSGRRLATFQATQNMTTAVRFSPDGSLLLCGGCDGTSRIYDTQSFEELAALAGAADVLVQNLKRKEIASLAHYFTTVAFAPDGKTAATGSDRGWIAIWELPEELRNRSAKRQR